MWPFSRTSKDEMIDNLVLKVEFLKTELEASKENTETLRQEYNKLVEFRNSLIALIEELTDGNVAGKLTPVINQSEVLDVVIKSEVNEPQNQLSTTNNESLVKAFEDGLNSQRGNVRGACVVRKPSSEETETKSFYSRNEANNLLDKFKKNELILVA